MARFSWGSLMSEAVKHYIRNQKEHHKRVTFQDEYREFLRSYGDWILTSATCGLSSFRAFQRSGAYKRQPGPLAQAFTLRAFGA